jgi:hypothetical protein
MRFELRTFIIWAYLAKPNERLCRSLTRRISVVRVADPRRLNERATLWVFPTFYILPFTLKLPSPPAAIPKMPGPKKHNGAGCYHHRGWCYDYSGSVAWAVVALVIGGAVVGVRNHGSSHHHIWAAPATVAAVIILGFCRSGGKKGSQNNYQHGGK